MDEKWKFFGLGAIACGAACLIARRASDRGRRGGRPGLRANYALPGGLPQQGYPALLGPQVSAYAPPQLQQGYPAQNLTYNQGYGHTVVDSPRRAAALASGAPPAPPSGSEGHEEGTLGGERF